MNTANDTHEDTEADVHRASQASARGKKTAENIRYGEAISEHGFGGETVGNSGVADNVGKEKELKGGVPGQMRREQGYGGGSSIGG